MWIVKNGWVPLENFNGSLDWYFYNEAKITARMRVKCIYFTGIKPYLYNE
jgi:hypothetical protein